jgi:hypothetical protein
LTKITGEMTKWRHLHRKAAQPFAVAKKPAGQNPSSSQFC